MLYPFYLLLSTSSRLLFTFPYRHLTSPALIDEFIKGFQVFDKTGKGLIGAGELRYVLTQLGEKMSDEEVDELLKGFPVVWVLLKDLTMELFLERCRGISWKLATVWSCQNANNHEFSFALWTLVTVTSTIINLFVRFWNNKVVLDPFLLLVSVKWTISFQQVMKAVCWHWCKFSMLQSWLLFTPSWTFTLILFHLRFLSRKATRSMTLFNEFRYDFSLSGFHVLVMSIRIWFFSFLWDVNAQISGFSLVSSTNSHNQNP